jgi:hypothetical protein
VPAGTTVRPIHRPSAPHRSPEMAADLIMPPVCAVPDDSESPRMTVSTSQLGSAAGSSVSDTELMHQRWSVGTS